MQKIVFLLLMLLISTQSLFALSLDEAKQQGLVGETPSGYLEAVSAAKEDVTKLLTDINARRKKEYEAIATKNKTTVNAVEQLAGKKAIEKTAGGQYVKIDGKWHKK